MAAVAVDKAMELFRAKQRSTGQAGNVNPDIVQIEIHIECSNLANLDVMSKSDPFAVLYAKSGHVGRLEIGRTETVFDDLYPRWCHSFILDYERNNPKTLVVEVFDRDSRSERLRKHDHIGSVECSLEDVREAPGKRLKLRLRNQHIRSVVPGYVSLVAEKVNPCDPALTVAIHVEAALLKRKNTTVNVGVSQFFTIMRAREEANGTLSYSPVYRSEAVTRAAGDGAGYARFKTANLTVQKLTNGFFKRPLRIQFHRRKLNGDHKLLGYVDTSLTDLCAMDPHGDRGAYFRWRVRTRTSRRLATSFSSTRS
eukprot:TRINITY_DN357_c0_g1_i4.p1 TRINITY_DN357_c0_g1~~TRINITY_DN357_c0_g1_i4.p1  ORF type:complete len:311 (+),score=97.20 TRINITY_DN357_c0_g1_i4:742-1674(+)